MEKEALDERLFFFTPSLSIRQKKPSRSFYLTKKRKRRPIFLFKIT